MANPSASTSDHFDLLPFISILMCVLGCLLLVTISMSAISMGAGAAEEWTPHAVGVPGIGAESTKEPILLEWDGMVATFQLPKRRVLGEWTTTNPAGDKEFQGALRSVAAKKASSYVLVAVRPSGFATLPPLLDVLRDAGLEVGYEPVDQGRSIVLATADTEASDAPPANAKSAPAGSSSATPGSKPASKGSNASPPKKKPPAPATEG